MGHRHHVAGDRRMDVLQEVDAIEILLVDGGGLHANHGRRNGDWYSVYLTPTIEFPLHEA